PGLKRNVGQRQIRGKPAGPGGDDAARIARQLSSSLADPMSLFAWKCPQIHPAVRPPRRWRRRRALPSILAKHQTGESRNREYDPEESVHLKLMGVYIE